MDLVASFGQRIRTRREEKGITQERLAEKTGISPSYISALERGRRTPPPYSTVSLLAEALDLRVEELWDKAEKARVEVATHKIRRGRYDAKRLPANGAPLADESSRPFHVLAEEIREEPSLLTALTHLKKILADERLKEATLRTLEALAQTAHSNPPMREGVA